jgi:glycosyltransferase involved in cell wall biosynthesis
MNYGLPTIVNANGSMADLNEDAVWKLPDEFSDSELVDALEKLWQLPELRRQFGERARERILRHHAPDACARQYAEAIETFYSRAANDLPGVIQSLANKPGLVLSEAEVVQLAEVLASNHPLPTRTKRLYLDVTATCRNDLKTGIERVARALTLALLDSPPEGYRVEPIYLNQENGRWLYRHARRYTLRLLGCPKEGLDDDVIEPEAGDVLLGLDLSGDMLIQAEQSGMFRDLRNRGIEVWATVFDLLPVRLPEVFPPGADEGHHKWLSTISSFDGSVCISKAVADDLRAWQNERGIKGNDRRPFSIGWFHLGADVGNSVPTTGTPPEAEGVLKKLMSRPTFLMVGTIEPRKGYLQVLDAFEQLWNDGVEVNLAIVGQEGWKYWVPEHMRRNIPLTIDKLRSHQQHGKRLFWLEGISDEYLEKLYAAGACLIAASYGEGFGLPLIEAAQHKLPIIARDIPVFREVAGDHAYYFDGKNSEDLAVAIKKWLALYEKGNHPGSDKMPWLTWKESAAQLLNLLIGDSEHSAAMCTEMGSKTGRNLAHET